MRVMAFLTNGQHYLALASQRDHLRRIPDALVRDGEKPEEAACRAVWDATGIPTVPESWVRVAQVGDVVVYKAAASFTVAYTGQDPYPVLLAPYDNVFREPTVSELPWVVALALYYKEPK